VRVSYKTQMSEQRN